jgi:uncharacterized protein (DUF924 family)
MMDATVLDAVHRYWFGEAADATPEKRMERWFRPSPEADAYIRTTFGGYLDPAGERQWDLTALSGPQQVALVVLLDQFPRQIYREDGRAFAYDAKALGIARELTAGDDWRKYAPEERMFLFLPFEHSESVPDQDRSIFLFAAAVGVAPDTYVEAARAALDFATKHRDLIRRFGRFPHRNGVLGRVPTPQEAEFLKGGRGF